MVSGGAVEKHVRNIFAITSVLERHEMEVLYAENGQDALDKLAANGDIDALRRRDLEPDETVTRLTAHEDALDEESTALREMLAPEELHGLHMEYEANLERSLRAADRLGGHIVQGHVDGVGTVRRVQRLNDAVLVDVEVTPRTALRVAVYSAGDSAISFGPSAAWWCARFAMPRRPFAAAHI